MKFRSSWVLLLGLTLAGCQVQDSSSSSKSDTTGTSESSATAESSGTGDSTGTKTGERKSVAFVTNQIADFWKIAEAGCIAASKEFDIDVQVIMPPEASAVVQKQKVEDVMTGGIQAIAPHPTNADILYVGAVNGGVWKTNNATAASPTWTPLTLFFSFSFRMLCASSFTMAIRNQGNPSLWTYPVLPPATTFCGQKTRIWDCQIEFFSD